MNPRNLLGEAWLAYSMRVRPHRGKQFLSRVIDRLTGPVRVKTPAGPTLDLLSSSTMDLSYLRRERVDDEAIMRAVEGLRPGDAFVDVGANIGFYAVLASRCVGAEGRVFAFEPSLREFQRLLSAIEVNHAGNVLPFFGALSDSDGEVAFEVAVDHTGLGVLAHPDSNTAHLRRVTAYRADALLMSNLGQRRTTVKIDVEGAELRVVRGMRAVLSRPQTETVVLEVTPKFLARFGDEKDELYRTMSELGFTPTRTMDTWQYDEVWKRA